MSAYEFSTVDGAGLRAHVTDLHAVYSACFAGPPYHEPPELLGAFPQRLDRHAGQPGVHGLLATDGGRAVAVIYGWPAPAVLPAGTAFDDAVAAAAPPEVAAKLVAPTLIVVELMVDPAHRRRGLARTLLHGFTAGAPRAWLATHPDGDAVSLYESQGWQRQFGYRVDGTPLSLYLWEPAPVTAGR